MRYIIVTPAVPYFVIINLLVDRDEHLESVRALAMDFNPLTPSQQKYTQSANMLKDLASIVREESPQSCFIQLYDAKAFPN